jgi:hypothetical protein
MVVGEIKRALDARLGRNVPLPSVYNLLHRHNWRKLAPGKRHPQDEARFGQRRPAQVNLTEDARKHVPRFPPYAPELNPVERSYGMNGGIKRLAIWCSIP